MKEEDLHLPLKMVSQDITTPGLVWVFDSKEKATRYRFHENHAELILRAVNSHEKLVKALEEARADLKTVRVNIQVELTKRGIDPCEGVPEVLQKTIDMANEALAAAKGE